jgi:hypothetical protein
MDRARIEAVVDAIAGRLTGEWLLLGGALVALWVQPRRVTEDIDVVGLDTEGRPRLALLQLAHDLGLPVEALNSAADFFVSRVEGWRDEVEPFRKGAAGTVLRPTPTLFVLLKVERLSETDLADCLAVIARAAEDGLRLDRERLIAAVDALPPRSDPAMLGRRASLRLALALRDRKEQG